MPAEVFVIDYKTTFKSSILTSLPVLINHVIPIDIEKTFTAILSCTSKIV